MIKGYILSQEADDDIEAIFEYGQYHFGTARAINYLVGLNGHIQTLAKNPDIGKERMEIKEGLFSFSYISHIIFYRKMNGYIRIIRILYGGRDLIKFLG